MQMIDKVCFFVGGNCVINEDADVCDAGYEHCSPGTRTGQVYATMYSFILSNRAKASSAQGTQPTICPRTKHLSSVPIRCIPIRRTRAILGTIFGSGFAEKAQARSAKRRSVKRNASLTLTPISHSN